MTGKLFQLVPAPLSTFWGIFAAIVLCLVLSAFLTYLVFTAKHSAVEINAQGLWIRGGVYSRKIEKGSVLQEKIRVVDLLSSPEYLPKKRLNGLGLPKYKMGWFRLQNGEKALVFLSDTGGAVLIPTSNGYSLLINPRNADEFIRTIDELW
jgi:hypothetical protein